MLELILDLVLKIKKLMEKFEARKWTPVVALELEFYLFDARRRKGEPVSIRHDPGVDLAARILHSGAEPVIEFWQRADGRPESEAFRVPLPSLEPGAQAQVLTKLRSVDPYDVCGHFTIFVDVVERPGAA